MTYVLAATGDLFMQRALVRPDAAASTPIYDRLRKADHRFVNLEMPLTRSEEADDKLVCLKGDPALAGQLQQLGVDVVTIANNHTMDFGAAGLLETISTLKAAGVASCGGGANLADALSAATLTADGLRVAFIGLATTLANNAAAGPKKPGIAPVRVITSYAIDAVSIQESPGMAPAVETKAFDTDIATVAAAVAAAKKEADIVVVGIHWGVPMGWLAANQEEIADYQQPLARALIDAGADAIIGHHPHVVQGAEIYKGRPILYSLGNFAFHALLSSGGVMVSRPYPVYRFDSLQTDLNRVGAIAELTWTDASKGPDCVLVPIGLNGEGEPQPATELQAEQALQRVNHSAKLLGCAGALEWVDGLPRIRLIPAA
jgi:hypothetical protein